MSSITPITSQLNNVGGCNSNNCCEQIAALTSRISTLEGKVEAAHSTANTAHGKANAAKGIADDNTNKILALVGSVSVMGGSIGSLTGEVGGLAAGLAALGARLAPLIIPVAGIAAIALLAAAAFQKATEATRDALTAQYQADKAIGTANSAIDIATAARGLANFAGSAAAAARYIAETADNTANAAYSQASRAIAAATDSQEQSKRAAADAAGVRSQAQAAADTADNAKADTNLIAAAVAAANQQINDIRKTAAAAQAAADRSTAAAANSGAAAQSAANRATATAANSAAVAQSAANRATATASDPTLSNRVKQLENKTGNNDVNSGKEDEIIKLINSTRTDVLSMPATLANSQTFFTAAVNAAATGACQSSRPGGCNGGSADQISGLGNIFSGIGAGSSILSNNQLGSVMESLTQIHNKLGSQVTGGLGKWITNIAEIANRSQILNIITWIGVLHNAYFLSNSLTQTLFSAVSNSLAALGLKDTSTNPEGTPFNVGEIVSKWTDGYFKSIFGVATVEGIKSDWKKYSRIYQAAAQVMYSIQSIGQSILGALEVVGSHVAKIGNALQKFRIVGEKAFGWMNPQPFFQNRFFTVLQGTQEVVSQIDQVASTVLSTQESITQLGKNKDDLVKSISEDKDGKKADAVPEAAKVKAAEDAAKTASKTPAIPESAQVKP